MDGYNAWVDHAGWMWPRNGVRPVRLCCSQDSDPTSAGDSLPTPLGSERLPLEPLLMEALQAEVAAPRVVAACCMHHLSLLCASSKAAGDGRAPLSSSEVESGGESAKMLLPMRNNQVIAAL